MIQEFYDGYTIEEISCLERALFGVISGYNPLNGEMFLMISKHLECYYSGAYEKKTIFDEKLDLIRDYWNLVLEIKEFKEEELLQALGSGKSVIVLINLKKLYYSSYYKRNDVLHPVIITGYDEAEEIYSILCNTFESKEYKGLYRFAMRREDLISCAQSYEKEFFDWSDGKGLIVFSQTDKRHTPIDVWQQWIENYRKVKYRNRELIYLLELKETTDSEEFKMIVNRLMNLEKGKYVFVNEFLKLSKIFYKIQDDKSDVIQLGENLCEQWRKHINRSIRQILHGKFEKVDLEEKEIQLLEDEFQSILVGIADKNNFIGNKDEQKVFENNEDKIITATDRDEYIFEFSNKRLYNTWIVDESPKVYTKKIKFENLDPFTYQIHLKRLDDEDANYFAGIVLKIEQDILFFGYDSIKGINIDIANKDFSLANMQTEKTEFDLQVHITTDSIEFICDGETFYKVPIKDEQTARVGIGCKTYNQPNYLKLGIDIK